MKKLLFNEEARKPLQQGINAVAEAVKVTLGPSGRNVIISNLHGGEPIVTKDGVTVAESITTEDPYENVGVEMMKRVAGKTVDDAGDGTTTATVLAQYMINEGLSLIDKGANPMDLKKGMDKAVSEVVKNIKSISQKIDGDAEKIRNVATISANNDTEIGNLIASAFEKIGDDGIIDIEDSQTGQTSVRVVEGMRIDRGWINKYFITDSNKMEVLYEDANIIVTDAEITTVKEIDPLLGKIVKNGRPIVLVCADITGEALAFVLQNRVQGGLKITIVKTPSAYRADYLADIATLTGATVISDALGTKLENATLEYVGSCGKVVSTEHHTSFIEGKGKQVNIDVRKAEIKSQLETADLEFNKDRLKKRLARISGGVAIMSVGASTDIELKEKKDRVDDAVRATRSAIEEGVVTGGGSCLLSSMGHICEASYSNETEIKGSEIIYGAMSVPLRQILDNCGVRDEAKVNSIVDSILSGESIGYNAKTMQHEDLFKTGVIDAAKVVRVALENACSIATMVITSTCSITEIHKKAQGI